MGGLATISYLERIRAAVARGDVPALDDMRHLAEGLGYYLDRNATTLDAAFGLDRVRGEVDPRQELARRRRDDYLKLAATRHCLDAGTLADQLKAYAERGGWPHNQHAAVCPERKGTVEELLWHALKAWPRTIKRPQIENILEIGSRSNFEEVVG